MPRGNAVNLIPWPYRWLAVAALAVALIGFGWVKGAGHVQSKWDAAAQQQTLHVNQRPIVSRCQRPNFSSCSG